MQAADLVAGLAGIVIVESFHPSTEGLPSGVATTGAIARRLLVLAVGWE
jgi:hypothetical protein